MIAVLGTDHVLFMKDSVVSIIAVCRQMLVAIAEPSCRDLALVMACSVDE